MIIGSVLANFRELELSTADDKKFTMKTSLVNKLALKLIGLPHLGFRRRAGIILSEARRIEKPDLRVLDAGCGYGLYSMTLADRGVGKIEAVDIDAQRIASLGRMVSEQPHIAERISLKTGSVTEIPAPDSAYDMIICSEVIEHVAEHEKAVSELARVLKPGGTLLLSVPADSSYNRKTYRRFDHQRPGYSHKMLSQLLAPHGVSIEKNYYYEFAPGIRLFNAFNAINSKPLMGLLFYPMYALYRLDSFLEIGEPCYTVIRARKSLSL